jgi:hypothetical protein
MCAAPPGSTGLMFSDGDGTDAFERRAGFQGELEIDLESGAIRRLENESRPEKDLAS